MFAEGEVKKLMTVTIVFLVLTGMVIVGTVIYLKMYSPEAKHKRRIAGIGRKTSTDEQEAENTYTEKEKSEIKKMWGIEDIRDGIIYLTQNRYRRIIAMGSLDFHLLSQAEQSVVEEQLMQTAMSLQFPIQFITTTERINTQDTIKQIDKVLDADELYNEKTRGYASKMRLYLNKMMEDRGVYVRRSYAIVCSDEMYDRQKAIDALDRYTGTIINALSRAKINCIPMNTTQILDLLYRELNKGSPVVPSKVISEGGLELYSTGLGVIEKVDLDEIQLYIKGSEDKYENIKVQEASR